jgi:ABC-type multidrug transport system fused ATPase/permease subunit
LIALNVLVAFGDSITPIISGRLFDSIISLGKTLSIFNTNYSAWTFYLLLWAMVQVVYRTIDYIRQRKHSVFQRKVAADYNFSGAQRLFYLPLSFHKDSKMGNTVNRINKAANSLQAGFEVVFQILPEVLSIIMGFAFVFYIKWEFGLMLLASSLIYLVFMIKTVVPTGKIRQEAFRLSGNADGILYDSIGNIKNTKQASAEGYTKKRFAINFFGEQKLWLNMDIIILNTDLFQKALVLLLQGSVFLTSIYFIQRGELTVGSLIAVNAYLAMTFGPITYFVRWWRWVADCFVALERAEKIFKTEEEIYDPKDMVDLKKINGDIEFKNVHFEYEGKSKKDNKEVLKNVSFKIHAGETVALVGESGVGKTTIADLMSAYYFPQRGSVLIDGVDSRKISLELLRKNIGLVSQEISIFNESIKYNIKYGNFDKKDRDVVRASKEAGAHEFVREFKKKYNQLVGERGIKLSGGQRQRVAIAQAILKDARILVLDEPTSALDAKTESVVAKSLEKLMKGRTTIIIAHRLATVRKADKIIVLEKGRVVEIGKHNDLIKKRGGAYRKFYELQKL